MPLTNIKPQNPNDHAHIFHFNKRLTEITSKLWPNESYMGIRDRLKEIEANGVVDLKKSKTCWSEPPHTPQIKDSPANGDRIIEHYVAATIYTLQARFTKSAELSFALIRQVEYHLGALEWHITLLDDQEMKTKRAVAGGNSAKTKKEIAMKKLEELLSSPPEQGWGSVEKTAEMLTDTMEKFIIEEGIALSVGDTFSFIKKSIAPNKIHSTYLKNTKKNLKTQPL